MLIFFSMVIISCAKQSLAGPKGGPKDETPPAIDTIKSTPNYQTRFTDRKIELVFDEWIQSRSLISKLLISPPLKFLPKLQTRGKKVTIEFNEEEVLKENATYIFNLGDAISDFREGNKVENLNFVFSTGDVIDSLGFSGTVVDALSGKPVQDIYVMMYDDLTDSVVYKEKPFYFVKTNKEGKYTFQNIRADTFKLLALKDGNLNYTYDKGLEQVGFIDSLIHLTDSVTFTIDLEVFVEEKPPQFSRLSSAQNGKINLAFKDILMEYPEFRLNPEVEMAYRELKKDTLVLYTLDTSAFTLYIQDDTLNLDMYISDAFKETRLKLEGQPPGKPTLSPRDSLKLTFDTPITTINIDSIYIYDTSSINKTINTFISGKKLSVTGNWKSDSLLTVLIKPNSVKDIYGRGNDSITFSFLTAPIEKYGDVIFELVGLDSSQSYVVKLMKGQDELRRNIVMDTDSTSMMFNTLVPGEYSITVLEDKNRNGRWSPGSYDLKQQAEDIVTITLEALRENWELQARYHWKNKTKE
jgi:hypothetical protein